MVASNRSGISDERKGMTETRSICEVMQAKQIEANLRSRVYYEITPFCNLNCIHCSSLTTGFEEMLTADQIVQTHLTLRHLGVESAVISGGEPFLRKDCIEIIEGLAALGSVVVTTNGTILPIAELATLLRKYPQLLIQFSWDGVSKATFERIRGRDTHDRVCESLRTLTKQGFGNQIALSMTVMRANLHEVEEMFQFAVQSGVRVLHIPSFLPVGKARDRWNELALSAEQLYNLCQTILIAAERYEGQLRISSNLLGRICARSMHGFEADCINQIMIKVGPNGLILPCPAASDPDLALGNVQSFDLARELLPSLQGWRDRLFSIAFCERSSCSECAWNEVCAGRFCANCGLLSSDLLEPAIETMCYVSQGLYRDCALALKWRRLLR